MLSWDRLSRVIARDTKSLNGYKPQSWKYVESNIRHAKWFFCRNPYNVFRDLVWWVRHRTTHRFHVLHINSLKPGWWDTDTRLLHAAFTLLEEHVEKEKPFKVTEWNSTDESREHANEIHDLYLWWKRRKNAPSPDTIEEEDKAYKTDSANLIRLINIRGTLWT